MATTAKAFKSRDEERKYNAYYREAKSYFRCNVGKNPTYQDLIDCIHSGRKSIGPSDSAIDSLAAKDAFMERLHDDAWDKYQGLRD